MRHAEAPQHSRQTEVMSPHGLAAAVDKTPAEEVVANRQQFSNVLANSSQMLGYTVPSAQAEPEATVGIPQEFQAAAQDFLTQQKNSTGLGFRAIAGSLGAAIQALWERLTPAERTAIEANAVPSETIRDRIHQAGIRMRRVVTML